MLRFSVSPEQKYWAKDIIFLITEHEQLGMQAWLDAYHGVTSGQDGVLIAGDLEGRAGSIQAAINLEIHAMKVGSIDIKVNIIPNFYSIIDYRKIETNQLIKQVEGLNGQLPNLDLFNLAANMITKEGIPRSFQRRFDVRRKDELRNWWYRFNTLLSMIWTQATGVPTGNHGLFHRYNYSSDEYENFVKNLAFLCHRGEFLLITRTKLEIF